MAKPRVIIADEDEKYIVPLQLKFVKEFPDQIELEIITDRSYLEELFSEPQKAEIVIISEELYAASLQKHNIANIFVMMEQYEEGGTEDLSIYKLCKYTSIREIFHEIVGKSANVLRMEDNEKKETQIVLVTSANGGAGKTTVAMGVSACLAGNYKRVLYLNACRLQYFLHLLDNQMPVMSSEIYVKLANPTEYIYEDIKHTIRKEMFSYLPAFKAALVSLGIKYSVFAQIALGAKASGDFDFIVIDAESVFDENKAELLGIADKVILVTEQSVHALQAVNTLISNINGIHSDKYIFVCNRFDKEEYNALIAPDSVKKFTINEYIERFDANGIITCEELSRINGIRKTAFLVL